MPYEIKLDVFEGPLDLLLQLITRRRVDIYEVSLASITEEYLAAIEDLHEMDLEQATGFLIVAATLLELKSARLLPAGPGDEADARLLEERDLLLARLVECATYRTAGAWLQAQLESGAAYVGRTAGLEERYARLAPDPLKGVSIDDLLGGAARVLIERPPLEIDLGHVAPITASVRDTIAALAPRLAGGGPMGFRELCPAAAPRIEVVVHFLALLELFKAGAIELEQPERFGDIVARWTGDATADEALAAAEEYTADLEGGR